MTGYFVKCIIPFSVNISLPATSIFCTMGRTRKMPVSRFAERGRTSKRVVGEWLMQAHGTRYDLPHEPFVPFDIMTGTRRITYHTFLKRIVTYDFHEPLLIHLGQPITVERVLKLLEPSGHGALDPVEGAVWRVERDGEVDFLCKYVRPDKVDGCYLPELNGGETIWNIDPKELLDNCPE
jgi:hypothetical protein